MKKHLYILPLLAAAIAVFIFFNDIETSTNHLDNARAEGNPAGTVVLSVDYSKIFAYPEEIEAGLKKSGKLKSDGILLKYESFTFYEVETAFDLLKRVAAERGIQIEFSGLAAAGNIYVEGIGYVYEYSCGATSGWIFFINGQRSNIGASEYVLRDGDRIDWRFSCKEGDYS